MTTPFTDNKRRLRPVVLALFLGLPWIGLSGCGIDYGQVDYANPEVIASTDYHDRHPIILGASAVDARYLRHGRRSRRRDRWRTFAISQFAIAS